MPLHSLYVGVSCHHRLAFHGLLFTYSSNQRPTPTIVSLNKLHVEVCETRFGKLLLDLLQILTMFVRQDHFNPPRRSDMVRLRGDCTDRRRAENDRETQSVETFYRSMTRFASNRQSRETVSFGFTVISRS